MIDRGNGLQLDVIQTLENPSTRRHDEPRSHKSTRIRRHPLEFLEQRLDEE
jgi:hypothetical protein